MASIKFDAINVAEKTVTVLVNDVPVTRPLPEEALASEEALAKYMEAYVAGLKVEFPDKPEPIPQEQIPFAKGQEL